MLRFGFEQGTTLRRSDGRVLGSGSDCLSPPEPPVQPVLIIDLRAEVLYASSIDLHNLEQVLA